MRDVLSLDRIRYNHHDLGGHKALIEWLVEYRQLHYRHPEDEVYKQELRDARAAVRTRTDRYEQKRWLDSQRYRKS